jgi:hypothetical protein
MLFALCAALLSITGCSGNGGDTGMDTGKDTGKGNEVTVLYFWGAG